MAVVVRDAELSDALRILEIYSHYVAETAVSFEYTVPTPVEFEERMRGTMARYPYLVAERDGVVAGYVYAGAFKSRAAYSWSCEMSIYLDRNAHRQGLGRKLYDAMEQKLRAMGIRNLYACIACPAGDSDPYLTWDSPKFHSRMGYQTVGTFHKCASKFGRWYDMIWMEKYIGGHEDRPEKVVFCKK